jgi:hypothetical protein
MKRILFILATLFATAQSQTIQTIGAPTTTVVSRGNFRTDSIFYLPKRQKLPTDSGAVRYQISDSSVYYWSGFQWRRLGVHIDTASMLNPYLRGSGTANYFPKFDASRSVINSKLYESGTNLLFNTTAPSFTSAGITTIENNATSSAVYTYKIADTIRAYMGYGGANTFDINNLKDGDIRFYTSATLRGRFQTDGTFRLNSLTGTGTRSVVADANGVLSASSSPTDLIDTTIISTRSWKQKGDDSLGALIALKVNISDTSSMLSPYLRKVDTTAMLSPYARTSNVNASLATKLNISDTATMLSPYLKESDTAFLSNRINLKVNISDTATMLSPYLKESDTTFLSNRINLKVNISDTSSMLTNYIRHAGNGLTKSGQALSVDTATIATRARVQKGIDSVATLASAGVTSVATGYGLSGGTITTTGTIIVDSAIVASRLRVGKVVDSLALVKQNVLTNPVTGTGTTNYVPKFTGTSTIGNSTIFDDGEVKINTTSDQGDYKLQLAGNMWVNGSAILGYTSGSNTGIRTPSPTSPLTVFNPTANTTVLEVRGGGGSSQSRIVMNYGTETAITAENALILSNTTEFTFRGRSGRTMTFYTDAGSGEAERARITTSGELLLNTTTDAGDYKLQVSGNAYVTGTTVLAATSGNVGVGTASPSYKLHTNGTFDISNMIESTTSGVNSNATMRLKTATEGHWGIQTGNAVSSGLRFYDISANAERFRMHSNGGLKFVGQSAAPTAEAGTVYYDTDDNKLKVYNGTTWVDLH